MVPKMSAPIAAATLMLAACADRPVTGPDAPAESIPLLARGSTPIPLSVVVHGPPGAFRITDDGLGAYVDGQQGVVAQIDADGNLQFGSSAAPLVRKLVFDFSVPIGSTSPIVHGGEADEEGFKIKTNPNLATSRSPRIGDLGINGNPASACYSATASHAHTTMRYVASYNTAANAQSGQVRVTRQPTTPTSWTMVTNDPTCGANLDIAALSTQSLTVKNDPGVYRGTFSVPFALTLTAR